MREVFILTQRELKSAFRETSVVLYSILLPLLLYPFLLWLMVTALTFIEGQREHRNYDVAYQRGLSEGDFSGYLRWLRKAERLTLHPVNADKPNLAGYQALLYVDKRSEKPELAVLFAGDRPESVEAKERLLEEEKNYNESERKAWFEAHGHQADADKPFLVLSTSTAASSDIGGYLLGALLPIGLLVMIALGGAYPAIDTTAGERERGTWETLQVSGPSITTIVVSKYLYVSIMCCLSGFLNLFAMLISIRSIVAPLLRDNSSITFSVGPTTLAVLAIGVIGVSFFVASALMLCAIFARTFREGQALTTPMFMMIALPVLPLSDPGLELTPKLALVPLVNLALAWREALQGQFPVLELLETLGSLSAMVVFALWLGSRLLLNESLMSGSGVELTWQRFWNVMKGAFSGV